MTKRTPKQKLLLCLLCLFAAISTQAQGGKAEPKRIIFAAGKSSATLTGRLSNAQEMEYVFAATKGQKVTITNPKTNLFDLRVFNQEFDFNTEYDGSPTLTFDIPETGDFLLFVRKLRVKSPRTARFSLTIAIK